MEYPRCPNCARMFAPGATWKGANYCRAMYLVGRLEGVPGLTCWELSQATGMAYADVSRGMTKARDRGAVSWEAEEREQGGRRYRYWPADGWDRQLRCGEQLALVD